MSGGGGKGGSQTQATEIPKWIEEPSIRNLARAEDIQRIAYMPWQGPDVAAFNPTQQMAMQSNMDAASAFGLAPQGSQALQGMPQAQTFANGMQGYSSMPLYEQALAETKAKQPGTVEQYNALFSPRVDAVGNPLPTMSQQVAQGNTSSYGNYGLGVGSDVDLSSYVQQDGSIDWASANNPQYGVVGGVGFENPNHSGTGYTGTSANAGSPESYSGGGDMGGGYDVGDDSVGIASY